MDIKKDIGRRLREARKFVGMTQEKLAEKADLSPNFIRLVEGGRSAPSIKTLHRLTTALGVELHDFFRMDAPREKETQKIQASRKVAFYLRNKKVEDIELIAQVCKALRKEK